MKNFRVTLLNVLSAGAVIATAVMMLHIIANAISRSLFRTPIPGTNELVGYWELPMIALLGLAAAQLRREHIEVSIFVDRFPRVTRVQFAIMASAVVGLLSLAFMWFGLVKALDNMSIGATGGVTGIPIWPVTFLVPIVFLVILVLCILDILDLARNGMDAGGETDADNAADEYEEGAL